MWKQLNIKLIMKSEDFSSKSVKIAGGKKSSAYRVGEGRTTGLPSQLSAAEV